MATFMIVSVPSYPQNQKEKKLNPKAEMKAQRKAWEEAVILKCIEEKTFKIVISRIYPTESTALQSIPGNTTNRSTSDGYYVQLENDLFSCYLPYMGVARTAIMGGQNLSLEAKSQKVNLLQEYDAKSESYLYQFTYQNSNMNDQWKCTIQLFKNGEANIRMDGNSRDAISYRGELQIPNNKQ